MVMSREWTERYGHVDRMDRMQLPKIVINWKPEGRKPGKMGYIQR